MENKAGSLAQRRMAAKEHKERKRKENLSLCSLRCNPSESRIFVRILSRAESAESAEKPQKKKISSEFISSLRPQRLCAEQFLPGGFWVRLAALCSLVAKVLSRKPAGQTHVSR